LLLILRNVLTAFRAVHFSTARSKTALQETDSFSSYDCRPRATYPQQFCFEQFRCHHWKEHEELLKLNHLHGISAASARSQLALRGICVSFRLKRSDKTILVFGRMLAMRRAIERAVVSCKRPVLAE